MCLLLNSPSKVLLSIIIIIIIVIIVIIIVVVVVVVIVTNAIVLEFLPALLLTTFSFLAQVRTRE